MAVLGVRLELASCDEINQRVHFGRTLLAGQAGDARAHTLRLPTLNELHCVVDSEVLLYGEICCDGASTRTWVVPVIRLKHSLCWF